MVTRPSGRPADGPLFFGYYICIRFLPYFVLGQILLRAVAYLGRNSPATLATADSVAAIDAAARE
jgi:hypothetical protein